VIASFRALESFRLEPKAKMAGRGTVRPARPILERFDEAMGGKTFLRRSMRATRGVERKFGGARRNRTADNGSEPLSSSTSTPSYVSAVYREDGQN